MRWLDEFDDDHGCPARRTHVGVVRGVVGIDGRWRVFGVVGGVLTQERQDPSQGSCPQVVGEEPEVADAVESCYALQRITRFMQSPGLCGVAQSGAAPGSRTGSEYSA